MTRARVTLTSTIRAGAAMADTVRASSSLVDTVRASSSLADTVRASASLTTQARIAATGAGVLPGVVADGEVTMGDIFSAAARLFDIDDVPPRANNVQVTEWVDRGSIGTTLTVPTTNGPLYHNTLGPMGGPTIYKSTAQLTFLRADDGIAIAQPYTIAAVHFTGSTALRTFLSSKDDQAFARQSGSGGNLAFGINAGALLSPTPSLAPNTWRVLIMHFSGANSAIFANGVEIASGNAGANAFTGIQIGGPWASTSAADIRIPFFGVWQGIVSHNDLGVPLMTRFSITP